MIVLKDGDIVAIYWVDYEIQCSKSAANLANETPCILCTVGRFCGESKDGIYYIIAHNFVSNYEGQYIEDGHTDCTRILIKGIAKIDKFIVKPIKKKAVSKVRKSSSSKKKKRN